MATHRHDTYLNVTVGIQQLRFEEKHMKPMGAHQGKGKIRHY